MNRIWKGLLIIIAIAWSGMAFSAENDGQEAAETAPAATEAAAADENALPSGIGWQLVRSVEMGNTGKFVHMVLVDKEYQMEKTVYSAAITKLCGKAEDFCRVRFWIQKYFIPEKLIPTAEQQKAQRAEFLLNRRAGIERTQWSCYVEPDKSQCINW